MASVIIVYGSETGNTELLANYIKDGLEAEGADVSLHNVRDLEPNDLLGYDIIVLGSSTWHGGLQRDFEGFYDDMQDVSLQGKKAAAFGAGDAHRDTFCTAVDMLARRLYECGAELVVPNLKVDGRATASAHKAREWGRKVALTITRA